MKRKALNRKVSNGEQILNEVKKVFDNEQSNITVVVEQGLNRTNSLKLDQAINYCKKKSSDVLRIRYDVDFYCAEGEISADYININVVAHYDCTNLHEALWQINLLKENIKQIRAIRSNFGNQTCSYSNSSFGSNFR